MAKKAVLLLIFALATLFALSSFLLIELSRLNREVTELKREQGEYLYDANWITKFVGRYPVISAEQAKETYLMLVDRAPRRSSWIIYLPEDGGLPLKLEALVMDGFYEVNGTFRNYAVNCLDARLAIVYSVFKNGTAQLESVKTICSGYGYQHYP